MEPADIKRVRGVSAAPAPGDALAAERLCADCGLPIPICNAKAMVREALRQCPEAAEHFAGPAALSFALDSRDAAWAEVAALREAVEWAIGQFGWAEDMFGANDYPRNADLMREAMVRLRLALATPSAADALVERVRAEALEEAADEAGTVLLSVSEATIDEIKSVVAAIRALKGGKHG